MDDIRSAMISPDFSVGQIVVGGLAFVATFGIAFLLINLFQSNLVIDTDDQVERDVPPYISTHKYAQNNNQYDNRSGRENH